MNPILIIGMHRSGTSCLAGIAQAGGLQLGDVFTKNPHNLKGNREHSRVMALNDEVLRNQGGSWDCPQLVRSWTSEQVAQRDSILSELGALSMDAAFGFKDPRTLFTWPFWREARHFNFLGTFRHPLAVAASLRQRNNFSIEAGLRLWQRYNERLIELHDEFRFPLVEYGINPLDYQEQVAQALFKVGFKPRVIQNAASFFDASLRNQDATDVGHELTAIQHTLYKDLIARRVSIN